MKVTELIELLQKQVVKGNDGDIGISMDPDHPNEEHRLFSKVIFEVMEDKGNVMILCGEPHRNYPYRINENYL